MKAWLRRWLEIGSDATIEALLNRINENGQAIGIIQNEIRELRAEVTRLTIAQYVPPQQPEPEKKVIQTRTMKQYLDILEREQQETSDAL